MGSAFDRSKRVRRSAEFVRALQRGFSSSDGTLRCHVLPNETDVTRLGLIVGRRHGNAVARNRIKRVIRAAFRSEQADLPPGYDLLVAPRIGADVSLDAVRKSLRTLMPRLASRARRTAQRGDTA